jgi:hypothetical protein
MTRSFYQKLVESFSINEQKDYEAVCSIIDKKVTHTGLNVVVVSDDPYLLYLIFVCLIRYYGIRIHIVNMLEGESEVFRLLNVISPDLVIDTEYHPFNNFHNTIWIGPEEIIKQPKYEVDEPIDTDYTVLTYSPYPTKINKISSDAFEILVNSLIEDLNQSGLIKYKENGIIPFISTNSDYLLYFIALKLTYHKWGVKRSLTTKFNPDFPIKNREQYWQHSTFSTLFIPKKEFLQLWEDNVMSLFEYKFVFKSYIKRKWLVNLLVKRRLKKLFKGFSNVVIIGMLDNLYMIDVLKNLSFVKVYTILPIASALHYGPKLSNFESIIPSSKSHKVERFVADGRNKHGSVYSLYTTLFEDFSSEKFKISDSKSKFQLKINNQFDDYGSISEYFYLGDINNAFNSNDICIFPETLEKVINSYPFIKECVLLTFNKKIILLINARQNILDSNRINSGMFKSIIQSQIDTLNKELPEEYRIRGFAKDFATLIDKDRNGEIVRFPYRHLDNK